MPFLTDTLIEQKGLMKRILREAMSIIALSLAMALLYNAASPNGIKINRKPMPASQEREIQAR